MSRIVLCWELGSNLGHLSRLLPLAQELRRRRHEIVVVVRDVGLAAELLAPSGIPFLQAPRLAEGLANLRHPASYADMLFLQGWANSTELWGAVQAWGNLLRLARAAAVVADYSPTALLAARIMNLPATVLGTGFEVPPPENPLPSFPGVSDRSPHAMAAEPRVLACANEVLKAHGAQPLEALRDLFQTERRWLTTFAELDQYGARAGEAYIGPINRLEGAKSVSWPEGFRYRVLAYLRPNTPGLKEILSVLASRAEVAVICAVPGLSADSLALRSRAGFQLFSCAVSFPAVLPEANLMVSYGPAASVTQALLKGVPQLIAPVHVEAQMTAVRVLAMGAGLVLRDDPAPVGINGAITRVLSDPRFKVRALEFAARHSEFDPARAVCILATEIETVVAGGCSRTAAAG